MNAPTLAVTLKQLSPAHYRGPTAVGPARISAAFTAAYEAFWPAVGGPTVEVQRVGSTRGLNSSPLIHHSANEPSAWRHIGARHRCSRADLRTAASFTVTPRPGSASREMYPSWMSSTDGFSR